MGAMPTLAWACRRYTMLIPEDGYKHGTQNKVHPLNLIRHHEGFAIVASEHTVGFVVVDELLRLRIEIQ